MFDSSNNLVTDEKCRGPEGACLEIKEPASHGILVRTSLGTAAVRPAYHQTSKVFSSVNPVDGTVGTGKPVTHRNCTLLKENAMATVHGIMGLQWAVVTRNGNLGHRIGGENLSHTLLI